MQRGVVHVLLIFALVGGSIPGVAAAAEPTVSIAVDGTPMEAGDELLVPRDPVLEIDASAETTVERVVIRVGGETVHTWTPGTERVSKRYELHLQNKPQHVQVIVTDASGKVRSVQVTVEKDAVAPFIGFTDPFDSDPLGRPMETISVSESRVALAGVIKERSDVAFVRIRREHRVQELTEYSVVADTYTIRNPEDNFSQELFLGPEENRITVTVQDQYGHSRRYAFTLTITDVTDPEIRLDGIPEQTSRSSVLVNGTVTDNVQVDSISYSVFEQVSRRSIIVSEGREANPERQALEFGREIDLQPGRNHITIWARDTSGNEVKRLVTVDYVRNVVPTLSIDEAHTHLVDERRVHVYGAARDGRISDLSVETVDADGTVIDFEQVYDGGGVWNDIEFEEELALAASGETTVVVRAIDVDGTEHVTEHVIPDPTPAVGTEQASESEDPTPAPAPESGAEQRGSEQAANGDDDATQAENAGTTSSVTSVEDGGGGAFAVAALVIVLLTVVRLRDVTVDLPIEKYIDFDDTKPSVPSFLRSRR